MTCAMIHRPAKRKTGIYLIDSLGSGGAQRQFVELLAGLDRSRIEPVAVTYHDLDFFRDRLLEYRIRHVYLPKTGKFDLGVIFGLRALARQVQPDFVHSFLNVPNFYARMLRLSRAVPRVITSERSISIADSPTLLSMERAFWRLSDRIIVNAFGIRDVLIEKAGIHPDRIRVVHNGVCVDTFSAFNPARVVQIREAAGLRPKCGVLFGLIGRLATQKNHQVLIDAVARLKHLHRDTALKIGFWGQEAEPGYRARLEARISRAGLKDDVRFFEPEKDMASVYAACDAVILPSLYEGFPNVVLEAMAAGRFVIASDIVDNAAVVRSGQNGFLVKPNSTQALVGALDIFLRMSPETRREIEQRARKHVADHFSTDAMIRKTMAVYEELW